VRKILTGTSQYAVGVPATGFQNEELLTTVSVGTVPHTDRVSWPAVGAIRPARVGRRFEMMA
jgi:hypothetical protein